MKWKCPFQEKDVGQKLQRIYAINASTAEIRMTFFLIAYITYIVLSSIITIKKITCNQNGELRVANRSVPRAILQLSEECSS